MATKRRTKAERERAHEIEDTITRLMYQGIEENADDWRRHHLGASLMGHKCDRYLWLTFRWACNPKHDGKQLRLFARGDREEPAIVQDLRCAGMLVASVEPETGEQFRIRYGHLGGSCDGKVKGVPGWHDSDEWFVLEMKTSNKSSFDYLQSKRVRSSKREHFVQMQLYMAGLGLDHALYVVVCKDTDEIYVELIDRDQKVIDDYLARAEMIVAATEPPPRMEEDQIPCVYTSKNGKRWPCDYFEMCHGQQMPERNCRTCVDSTPVLDVEGVPAWNCSRHDTVIPVDQERTGCEEQLSIPPIVNAKVTAACTESREITYQFDDGTLAHEKCRDELLEEDDE